MENSKGVLGNVSVIPLRCNEYHLAHLKSISAWGAWNSWLLVNVCKSRKKHRQHGFDHEDDRLSWCNMQVSLWQWMMV